MNEVPDLMHLNEQCDNFAYCLDNAIGLNNGDLRAKDSKPFACAQYRYSRSCEEQTGSFFFDNVGIHVQNTNWL